MAFSAFDVLAVDWALVIDRPYCERPRLLEGLGFHGDAWCTTSSFTGATVKALTACVELGLEGVVLKRLDSTYPPGRRSSAWVTAKTSDWRTSHAPLRHEH